MNKFPKFYSGQKVVCVVGSELVKKGLIYTVDKIIKHPCGCYAVSIVGVNVMGTDLAKTSLTLRCRLCLKSYNNTGEIGFYEYTFKPVEEIKIPIMTFEKIKQKEKEEILINN